MCVCLAVMAGLVSTNDSKRYASCSFAIGRISHARQVKDEVLDEKRHIGSPGLLGVRHRVDNPTPQNLNGLETPRGGQGPTRAVVP